MANYEDARYRYEMSGHWPGNPDKGMRGPSRAEMFEQDTSTAEGDDLSVEVASEVGLERMVLEQAAVDAGDQDLILQLKDLDKFEQYLEAAQIAEEELVRTNPDFNTKIQMWVEKDFASNGQFEPSNGEVRDKYLTLWEELREEYEEAIAAGDVSALAEWDKVDAIVRTKIDEHGFRQAIESISDELKLPVDPSVTKNDFSLAV